MDTRCLQAFVTAVELGSISRAAARLDCAQPSLSAQIKQLERELGMPLLTRRSRGVTPTVAGREMYACATDMLARLESSRVELAGWADGKVGSLRAGIIPTLSKSLMPGLLPDFLARHPRIELSILEAYTGTLVDAVLADELDIAVVMMPRREASLARHRIGSDELTIIAGRGAALPTGGPVRLEALPPQKLVMPSRRHSLRGMLDQLIDSGALAVGQTVEIDGLLGTLQFLRQSDFIALLPGLTVADERGDPRLDVLPIASPVGRFDYSVIHHRRSPPSPAARVLIAQIEAGLRVLRDDCA